MYASFGNFLKVQAPLHHLGLISVVVSVLAESLLTQQSTNEPLVLCRLHGLLATCGVIIPFLEQDPASIPLFVYSLLYKFVDASTFGKSIQEPPSVEFKGHKERSVHEYFVEPSSATYFTEVPQQESR